MVDTQAEDITLNAKSVYLASFQVSLPLRLVQNHPRLKTLTQLAFQFNLVVLLCTYIIFYLIKCNYIVSPPSDTIVMPKSL